MASRKFFLAVIASCIPLALGQQAQNFDNVEVHVLPVQGNVYMLVGAGGNITMQVGKEGVLVVDTMYAGLSGKVIAAVRTASDKPIRYIINTHVHGDHIGGNEKIAKAGSTITAAM
jgi:cyclase